MKNISILIVEDEALSALRLKVELKKSGYNDIANVRSGEQAITKAESLKPDIILMDIRLAGKMDGIETSKKILSFLSVPIILMTGYQDEEVISRAREVNPVEILFKPLEISDILSILEKI